MSKARHETKAQASGDWHVAFAERMSRLLLPAVIALLVATHLIPSEAVAAEGTHAVLAMAWCALLVIWGTVTALANQPSLKFSWPDGALMLVVGLIALSGILPHEGAITRNSWNVVWVWISYGICAFLLRQSLHSAVQARAILAVMLGLAICLTAYAYLQYFVTMPNLRAEFQRDSEKMLRAEQIPLDPDSPTHRHFVDRLNAREPMATFALTNSLAGFLAPWIVVVAGLALVAWQSWRDGSWPIQVRIFGLLVTLAILVGCLLLTKSRTGSLAALAGVVLLALFGRTSSSWRMDWRVPALAAGTLVLLSLAAVAVGGLDVQVLSEAPKSVLYRLEYWQATAAMIADHPLLGCGPGNFQDYYARYKLPQASEMIADPHNALLEVWATAGTPALAALLAFLGLLAIDLGRRSPEKEADSSATSSGDSIDQRVRPIYVGGLAGIALGFGLAFITTYPLWTEASGGHIGIGLIGIPLAALFLWLVHSWVTGGPLPVWLPVAGLAALFVNLMAAGAAAFPGVVSSAWVLVAVACYAAHPQRRGWVVSRSLIPALIAVPLLLGMACFWTEYSPVLRQQTLLREAEQLMVESQRHPVRLPLAVERLEMAAEVDPYNSAAVEQLASLHFQQWLAQGDDQSWSEFVSASERSLGRRPASHRQYTQRTVWYMQAWRKSGEQEHLSQSLRAARQAVERYPASALLHAQLAWLHHLAGNNEDSRSEAALALQLDSLNPHAEFQLRNSHLKDPLPDDQSAGAWRLERPETAEQTLSSIRKQEVWRPAERPD